MLVDNLLQDLRYALRLLVKAPTFTAIALLTLAIGIGANATVFSFVSALLLRPAPGVADPGTLVAVFTSDYSSGPYGTTSYPDFETLRSDATAFSGVAAEQDDEVAVIRVADVAERVRLSSVSGEYFDVLGVKPALGRLLTHADTAAGAPPAAVIGYALWRRAFQSSPAALGSMLEVNGESYTIVGVTPAAFEGLGLGRAFEIWTPLVPPKASPQERGNRSYSVVARLARGETLRNAQTQVAAIAARLGQAFPDTNMGTLGAPNVPRPMTALIHTRLGPEFRGTVATIGAILMIAVALVLVIACANVASLLLSRATARDREMAVRLALGAGRGRLIRQLLTESVLLGVGGGALGLLLSLWTADALPSFFAAEEARMLDTSVDATAFAFVLAVSLTASMLLGLAPAVQAARPAAADTLRGASRTSEGQAGSRMRRVLVASQIAVAVVLLVAAALLVQSLAHAARADFGFDARDAVLASVELPQAAFKEEQALEYYRAALEQVRGMPGVQDAALARVLPFTRGPRRGFRMDQYQPQPGEDMEHFFNVVSERYFQTLQIGLIEGRTFDSRDGHDGPRVAIVNQVLANRYFRGKAVGRRMTDSRGRTIEIVGVVRSGKNLTPQDPAVPLVYFPLTQSPELRMTLIARTATDPAALVEPIRRELTAVNRAVPVFRAVTLSSHIGESLAGDRLTAVLVATCGAMALLLAAVGIYGVIAYAVARRTREIGVRVALGASPAHVIRLVLGEGVGVTAAGLLIGLVLAAAAARGLNALLFGVSSSDPFTYVAIPLVLALVAVLAALVPARRALRLEPNVVLRQE